MKKKILVIIFVLLKNFCFSQDPIYSQFQVNRIYLNPALAGIEKGINISSIVRDQWPNINSQFITASFCADWFEPNLGGGIGVFGLSNTEGDGIQQTFQFGLNYSYRLPIKTKKSEMIIGVNPSWINRTLNTDRFTYTDQYDPVLGLIYPTQANIVGKRSSGFKFNPSLGLIFRTFLKGNNSFITFGASAFNIVTPDISLYEAENKLPRRYSAHILLSFLLNPYSNNYSYYINPEIYWNQQRTITKQPGFNSIVIGINTDFAKFGGGIYYRSDNINHLLRQDAIIFKINLNSNLNLNKLKIAYSYDATISHLALNTGGSHEISLTYTDDAFHLFKRANGTARRMKIHCPDWGGGSKLNIL